MKLKRLDAQRCAPHQSASLIHERAMSLLNLALQHTSHQRAVIEDPALEALVRSIGSMAELRFKMGIGPPPKSVRKAPSKARVAAGFEPAVPEPDEEMSDASDEEMDDGDSSDEELAAAAKKVAAATAKAAASAATAAAEEAAKSAAEKEKLEKRKLYDAWRGCVAPVHAGIKERFEQLELKGKGVEVLPRVTLEVLDELHASLKEMDPAYDPAYRLNADLKKMSILDAFFSDPEHAHDLTYNLTLIGCGKADCKFKCVPWDDVPDSFALLLRRRPVIPMLDPDNPGHMYAYEKAITLPSTSERDFPSKVGKLDNEEAC